MAAAMGGLADLGYDQLTMDEIAARARAGKGALYRRWPSKAALVVAAIAAWRDEFGPSEFPDTGSLAGDIEAAVALVPDLDDRVVRGMTVIAGVATAASRDAELRAAVEADVFSVPRRMFEDLLRRAVARGEVAPDRDLDLLPDVVMGLNLMRVIKGQLPDRTYIRRVFAQVIYPLMTASPRTGEAAATAEGEARPVPGGADMPDDGAR
jgi:AcrR family transcriptional regulator